MVSFRSSTPLALAALTAALVAVVPAQAANYPTKQIELIVPFAAGGGTDLMSRALADALKNHLPQPIGVVNKTGGGGAIGFAEMIAARPDGYRIGMGTVELATLPPLGIASFKTSDLKYIAQLNNRPSAITVRADAPWANVKEFLEFAKENPGKIRIGNSGTGAIWHLAAASLEQKTGIQFSHIPYDGAAPAVTALLGGHIEAVTVSSAEVWTHLQNGTLKILAVMADERSKGCEDVPTLKENGVDVQISAWMGVVVPKKTPQAVVDTLSAALAKAVAEPSFVEVVKKLNMEVNYLDDKAFDTYVTEQSAFFDKLVGDLGLKKK